MYPHNQGEEFKKEGLWQEGEKGITQIRQSLAAYRTTGQALFQPYFLALLAEAYGKVGRAEEGLTALDLKEAKALSEELS